MKGGVSWQLIKPARTSRGAIRHERRYNGCCPFANRYAKGCEAVQDGDPDLELRDLTIKVPRDQSLAQQFDIMHLGFDAASAVVAAPSSPDRPAKAFGCTQGLVARDRAGSVGLPWLGVLARRDDGCGPACGPCRAYKHALPGSGWLHGTCGCRRHRPLPSNGLPANRERGQ